MSEHYFTKVPTSGHDEREFTAEILGLTLRFQTDAGVFSKDGIDRGTRALVEAMPSLSGRALDLGCGWGAAGIPLALKNPECAFLLTDINERAADLAAKNARANGADNVSVVTGDAFEAVEGTFSAIFTNPPIRAGKQAIYNMFERARDRLLPGGALYVVIRKQQGAPSALSFLRDTFSGAEVIDRTGGFWVIRAERSAEI
jgi:16S rRNA (guanine1207-N2)-methyltransferase